MKIIKQTTTQLIIEHRISIYARILVWFIISVGIVFAISSIKRTALNCQRIEQDQGTCQFNQEVFFMTTTETIKLQDITSAEVERKYYQKSYEDILILNTNQQKIVFDTFTSSSPSSPNLISEQINQFLRDKNQRSLDIQQDNRFYGTGILIFFLIITQAFLFVLGKRTFILDKELNQMFVKQSNLIWTIVNQYPLNKIKEVKLESSQDKSSQFSNSLNSQEYNHIVFVLLSGEIIPINSFDYFDRSQKSPILDQIKEFLDNEQN